ncbi:transcriptional regulator [Roseiconus nitratireducens]|uniref:Transcriptional regulator n=1 Tax=Roseiconus nitratireducens TaxID=2605748 RepID=A0A5M6DI94_9BACT|nr:transcriptional regulator [Roseiconus nitratireducens]KAA5546096.1 transcriptional regulator [Roseiconus nitratireducens]
MHKTSTGSTPTAKDDVPQELRELNAAIDALPATYRDAVAPALMRAIECSTRRRRILNLVQEALSQLRLDMKYLVFDLEATRRERDQYRDMLEKDGLM